MRRMGIVLASIALGVTGLAACSSGDEQYCSKLEEGQNKEALSNLDFGNEEDVDAVKEEFDAVIDVAPDDVKAEWESLSEAFEPLSEAAADPEEADMAELEELDSAMQEAMKTIETDAKERCGIELS